MNSQRDTPPVPRDHDDASLSELIPLRSTRINIKKSPLFLFMLITAIATVGGFMMFSGMLGKGDGKTRLEAFNIFAFLTCAYLLAVVLIAIHLYSRSDKPFWAFLLNAAFVYFATTIILGPAVFYVFRQILPGNMGMIQSPNYLKAFLGMFFAAGLAEELIKVSLVLLGAAFTLRADIFKPKVPEALFNALRIRGPLDGLLMGMFGGAGFILIETWGEYVPRMVGTVMEQSQGNELMAAGTGLMLLFPRVAGGIVGHMAWAGITGYFIGLAVLRSRHAPKLVLGGWATSSAIHAFWNTSRFSPIIMPLAALAGGVLFIACLLKARQMEQAIGREANSYGSIVVDRPPMPFAHPGPAPSPSVPPAPAMPSAPIAATPAVAPAPAAAAGTPVAGTLALAIADRQLPLRAGQIIDLARELGPQAAGIQAEVVQHPTRADVLGLKNAGTLNWTARLRDGSEHVIEPGRNLRLSAGVTITIGTLQARVVGQ